jgi:pimeloyl-ACP methyl ester carboxylesterase
VLSQVGCGNTFLASNSSCPPAAELTPQLYVQQIDALVQALKLQQFHLYGQGVGGILALSYAAQKGGKQAGVLSVSLGSVAPSYTQLISDRQAAARQLLGGEQAEDLLQANRLSPGSSGSSGDGPAAAAWQQYQQKCVSRFPAATVPGGCVSRASQQCSQPVFDALAGGQYFAAIGGLAGWSLDSINTAALQVNNKAKAGVWVGGGEGKGRQWRRIVCYSRGRLVVSMLFVCWQQVGLFLTCLVCACQLVFDA